MLSGKRNGTHQQHGSGPARRTFTPQNNKHTKERYRIDGEKSNSEIFKREADQLQDGHRDLCTNKDEVGYVQPFDGFGPRRSTIFP
jgi:hypothetical protein